jgi:hypothetical protein
MPGRHDVDDPRIAREPNEAVGPGRPAVGRENR